MGAKPRAGRSRRDWRFTADRLAYGFSGLVFHPSTFTWPPTSQAVPKEMKLKKGKDTSGGWILGYPELQRKKRVDGYTAFALEVKMNGSMRKGFRWIKDRCSHVVCGRW